MRIETMGKRERERSCYLAGRGLHACTRGGPEEEHRRWLLEEDGGAADLAEELLCA
jgi:hypothetical protein